MASRYVSATSRFGSRLKPRWLSLTCTKVKLAGAAAFSPPARPCRLSGSTREQPRMPPLTAQTMPVPAQAMHFRNPRRSTPSLLGSLMIRSFIASSLGKSCSTFTDQLKHRHIPEGRTNIPEIRENHFSGNCGNIFRSAAVWNTAKGANRRQRVEWLACSAGEAPIKMEQTISKRGDASVERSVVQPQPAREV